MKRRGEFGFFLKLSLEIESKCNRFVPDQQPFLPLSVLGREKATRRNTHNLKPRFLALIRLTFLKKPFRRIQNWHKKKT